MPATCQRRSPCRTSRNSHPRACQQGGEDAVRVEHLLRDRAGRAAVVLVVTAELLDAGREIVGAAERDDALAGGDVAGEAGVLGEDRAARGQVADAAVAEPA